MTTQEISDKFANKFKSINNTNGFYDFTVYVKGIGFSIRKNLNNNDVNNVSLLSFYIPDNLEKLEPDDKKSVIIDIAYGVKKMGGVALRDSEGTKWFGPSDLTSRDEYYFDAVNDKLFKRKKEISPTTLINEIYEQHIKSTKLIKGFWIRTKILFWRIVVSKTFEFISISLHWLLYILTGDKYTYEAVMGKEVLNDVITEHRFKDLVGKKDYNSRATTNRSYDEVKFTEKDKKSKTFNFFGYETSYWVIRSYSVIVLSLYLFFDYENWKTLILIKIFKNSLLILCFVILSLWLLEGIMPIILKKLVKGCSIASTMSLFKRIKI